MTFAIKGGGGGRECHQDFFLQFFGLKIQNYFLTSKICFALSLDFILYVLIIAEVTMNMAAHGCRTCIKRELIHHGNFFYFRAQKCIQNYIPEDQNWAIKGFFEKGIFLTVTHEKTTFRWSKVVSEAIFPTNQGYVCIKKWSQIFVWKCPNRE